MKNLQDKYFEKIDISIQISEEIKKLLTLKSQKSKELIR